MGIERTTSPTPAATGTTSRCRWSTIYRTDANDLISDCRVYTDIAPVFAGLPTITAPPVS